MAVSLGEANDVKIRLGNIRRMLDDFDKAIEFAGSATSNYQSLQAEIPELKKQRDQIQAEIDSLNHLKDEAAAEHQNRLDSMQKQYADMQAAAQAKLDAVNQESARAVKAHAADMEAMHAEFNGKYQANQKKLDEAEARLSAIIGLIEQHKSAMQQL